MDSIFDPNGKVLELLWKPIHIMFLNLLWLLFSLPIVTMGASTAALYSVMIKLKNGTEGKLFWDFWNAFRANFRQATIMWLIIVFAAVVFTTDIVFFVNMGGFAGTFLAMIFLGLDVALLLMGMYVFPLQAVFDNKIATTVKSAFFLSFRHIGWTVVLLALHILAFILVWLYWIVIGWFIFGAAAYVNACVFNHIFKRYYPTNESDDSSVMA